MKAAGTLSPAAIFLNAFFMCLADHVYILIKCKEFMSNVVE